MKEIREIPGKNTIWYGDNNMNGGKGRGEGRGPFGNKRGAGRERGQVRRRGGGISGALSRGLRVSWQKLMNQTPLSPSGIADNSKNTQANILTGDELEGLRKQSQVLEQQLATLNERIEKLTIPQHQKITERSRPIAIVDETRCTGFGICAGVCPQDAIHINTIAEVDQELCIGCGLCILHCPTMAISSGS